MGWVFFRSLSFTVLLKWVAFRSKYWSYWRAGGFPALRKIIESTGMPMKGLYDSFLKNDKSCGYILKGF